MSAKRDPFHFHHPASKGLVVILEDGQPLRLVATTGFQGNVYLADEGKLAGLDTIKREVAILNGYPVEIVSHQEFNDVLAKLIEGKPTPVPEPATEAAPAAPAAPEPVAADPTPEPVAVPA